MKWFSRNRGLKSQDIPQYAQETPAVQLRIMRTHIAAQAGEISNLNIKLNKIIDGVGDLLASGIKRDSLMHRKLNEIHQAIREDRARG